MAREPQLTDAARRSPEATAREALWARLRAMPGRPSVQKPVKAPVTRLTASQREQRYRLAPRWSPIVDGATVQLTGRQLRRIRHKARVGRG